MTLSEKEELEGIKRIIDEIISRPGHKNLKKTLIANGYGIDKLVYDISYEVRQEIAKKGEKLGLLIYDKDYRVRAEVANCGYGLEELREDSNSVVRLIAESKIKELELEQSKLDDLERSR